MAKQPGLIFVLETRVLSSASARQTPLQANVGSSCLNCIHGQHLASMVKASPSCDSQDDQESAFCSEMFQAATSLQITACREVPATR